MNTSSSKDKERLALLKIAYFEALALYDKSYTEEALTRLRASESAIQDFITGYEVTGIAPYVS